MKCAILRGLVLSTLATQIDSIHNSSSELCSYLEQIRRRVVILRSGSTVALGCSRVCL